MKNTAENTSKLEKCGEVLISTPDDYFEKSILKR
jgi:hypothetical protein